MKKTFLMIFAALAFMACSDDSINNESGGTVKTEPATEVYMQGQKVAATRAGAAQTATTYFFIRVDNRIPGAEKYSASLYFPQTAMGGSVFSEGNKGTVDLSYP